MIKSGVLVRRAALFTATVMAVTVAVSMCGFMLGAWSQANRVARIRLAPQAECLARAAANGAALESEAALFAAGGGYVWQKDADGEVRDIAGDVALPDNLNTNRAYGTVRIDGKRCAYAVNALSKDREGASIYAYIIAAQPVEGASTGILYALISALMGVACGVLAGRLLMERMLSPAVAPVAKLRDAAVAMADGHLETRADDGVDGELGELGKALNHLSDQLSRNMYTLIVERNRLRNILNGLSEGIVAIDSDGKVTHTNPALTQLIQKPKLVIHLPDARMKLIPDKSIWEDFDSVLSSGDSVTRNIESRDNILRMTITPIRDELNSIVGAVGLFSDITQMERLEKTRRDYVSNVSHELRTPLTAMRALVEPLKDGLVTKEEDRMRYYDIILREIMRLSRLINDQLELSRLQSGTLSIQKTMMPLDELVYDVCDRYTAIAEEHGLKLNVDTDFSQCPQVYANEDRVEQMLIILLDNAIKYTEKGSVSLSAKWDDEKVIVSVKDTGIGIEECDLPYVFDRFYKVDKAHSGKGSGLGLSIAKELLKRMDEDIWVKSEKGKGSEFSFTIHRNPPPAEDKKTEE